MNSIQIRIIFIILVINSVLLDIFILPCLAGRNFYEILGVNKDATDYEIKRNFRKLAVERHPDKNPNDKDAPKKFQDLRNAFEVLSDKEKRKLYDEGGEEKLDKMSKGSKNGGFDPFESFMGEFFGFSSESDENKETPKGADVVIDLWVTYEELYVGKFVQLQRIKPVYKQTTGTRKCNCRQEMKTRSLGPGRFQMMQQTVCDECPNMELKTQEKLLEVEIEPGMKEGAEQKFYGEGEPHIDGDPGDLKVRIRTLPHPVFERRGDDLYTNATISLTEALTGFTLSLKHLDGHIVTITREKITWPGSQIRKTGEGMTNFDNNKQKGLLYVTFDVNFPRGEISLEDKRAFRDLLSKYSTDSNEADNSIDNHSKSEKNAKFYNGLRGY